MADFSEAAAEKGMGETFDQPTPLKDIIESAADMNSPEVLRYRRAGELLVDSDEMLGD